jgi:nucleoid DNA-binding protein
MTTAELVKVLAERLDVSQRQARTLLDGYVAAITRQVTEKNSVNLRNFGSFTLKDVAEKRAYIPAKMSLCLIPAHQKLHFKAAKKLRDAVSEAMPNE